MRHKDQESGKPVQRLCSEIQLFDLCDLEKCTHKNGRFCTNTDFLARFESIAEDDLRDPQQFGTEDMEGECDDAEDDGFSLDAYGEEEDDWEGE
jgi:hypothetical protein